MSECGCNGNQTSPPGAKVKKTSGSAFAGIALRRGPCGPPVCPTPPTSEADERSPYCPTWVDQLKAATLGKLILVLDSCLYILQSKCSGYLHHDAETGQVSVKNPDFTSSLPRETRFGWLGKVVPTKRKVCVDGQDECAEEIHQELAAQVMNQASCGQLVVARPPLCGEVDPANSLNPETQVRLDFLNPDNHEEIGCPTDVRFLVGRPGTLNDPQQTPCMKWSLMRRLTFLASQLGIVLEGTPLEQSAFLPLFVPVTGGAEDDPCYQLRLSEQKVNSGLPTSADDCDTVEYRGKGTPTEGWKAVPKGLSFHPIERVSLYAQNTGSGVLELTPADVPGDVCGPIYAALEIIIGCTAGPSGGAARLLISNNEDAWNLAYTGDDTGVSCVQVMAKLTEDNKLNLQRAKTGTGTTSLFIRHLGFWY